MIFEILGPQRTSSCWKSGTIILSKYFARSFKTLSPLFMGDDNVLHIHSPSHLQRSRQHSAKSESEQTHVCRGRPRCYCMWNRFKSETHFTWTGAKPSLAVTWCQHTHKQSRKFSPSPRCFICLMPKIQIFGNIWIIDDIFTFHLDLAVSLLQLQRTANYQLCSKDEHRTQTPSLPSFSRIDFLVLLLLWSTFSVFLYFPLCLSVFSIFFIFYTFSFALSLSFFTLTIPFSIISTIKLWQSVLSFPPLLSNPRRKMSGFRTNEVFY